MKHLKNFKDNASFEAYLGGEIDYPVIAKVEEQVHALTPPPVPTIYYTTTDGNQIDDLQFLSDYIVSHTQESNGEYKIVLNEEMTSIPDLAFYGGMTVQTIRFENMDNIMSIGNQALICPSLQKVDLTSLRNVTTIGNYFLSNCTELTTIDLSPLSSVTSIAENFFYDCTGLTSIDLSPLSNVESIGTEFLSGCSSLQSIDLSPLTKAFDTMKSTPDSLLYNCSSIQLIDLTPLKNITTIEQGFLRNCSSLASIDLAPLSNVESIGNNFLHGCNTLQSIDLSPLSNVTDIGVYFIAVCSKLTTLTLPDTNTWFIGNNYLVDCSLLNTIYCPKGTLEFYKQLMSERAHVMVEIN